MDSTTKTTPLGFLWETNKKLLRVIAVVALGFSTAVGVFLMVILTGAPSKTWSETFWRGALSFLAATLAELTAATIIYLLSVTWIFPKIKKMEDLMLADENVVNPLYKSIYLKVEELKSQDVSEFKSQFHLKDALTKDIGDAESTIDVCVQGWDGLITHQSDGWIKFLEEKRGTVNLILPKITERSRTVEHVMRRLDRTRKQVCDEIENTYAELYNRNQNPARHGTVLRWDYLPMMWFCLIRIDDKLAYLSNYSQIPRTTVYPPFIRIKLDRCPMIKAWIDHEIKAMISYVSETDITSVQGAEAVK